MKLSKALATVVAVGAGFITLLGLLQVPVFKELSTPLLNWVSLLVSVGILVGALNLFLVHSKRVGAGAPGWVYSLLLVVSLFAVVALNLAAPALGWGSGPASPLNTWLFTYIQTAVSAALAGLLFFFLVLAGYRLWQRRPSLTSLVFITVAVVTLIGLAPLPGFLSSLSPLRDVRIWITQVPAVAGARGLLLGIALGVVATGLRVLLAQDRPYRE